MRLCCKGLSVALALVLCANTAWPCTGFVLHGQGRVLLARNLDWFWEDGLVLINPRGLQKTAFLMSGGTPAVWTARYGSVTFNQCGQELPFGGMNEAGLVVENMWLQDTEYERPDARPAVNLLQWIQYQLDNCRTVAEVIATAQRLRIEQPPAAARSLARVHYLICDAEGDRAAIELIDHKMVVHRGATMPCPALANDPYEPSLEYLKEHPQLAYLQTARRATSTKDVVSISRFARASTAVSAFTARGPRRDINYAFDTLKEVAQGDFTVWQIVYEISARKIHYLTRSNPQRRTIELKTLDFSGAHPVRFVSIGAGGGGRGLTFTPLTEERHRQYLAAFYAQRSLKEKLGETEPLMAGLLATLRGYRQTR